MTSRPERVQNNKWRLMIYEAFWAAISSMMSRKQQGGQAVEVGVLRHLDGAFRTGDD